MMAATMSFDGMTMKSTSQTAVITGVSRGIGRALAVELAKRGHTVIGCARNQDKLNSLRSELATSHNHHLLLNVDVSSNNAVEQLADIMMEKKVIPNILAILNASNKIWEIPVEEFDSIIDTNLKGVANVLRHFIPLMIPSKQGVIVNMSSEFGRPPATTAMAAPYCASKWGVEGLSKSVAKELPEGMAIVTLDPGAVNTDMFVSRHGFSAAALLQSPDAWALKAATTILNLTGADNGASLTM